MALYTPLARLGTFLFPSSSRRVLAAPPPPPPPPVLGKRSRAMTPAADADSPLARRRLSFADADVVFEFARPDTGEDARMLRDALASPPRWRDVAEMLARGVDPCVELDKMLIEVFADPPLKDTVRVMEDAAAALAVRVKGKGMVDPKLVANVLAVIERYTHESVLVETLCKVVVKGRWGRKCPGVFNSVSAKLIRSILGELEAPGLDVFAWKSLMTLLGVFGFATTAPIPAPDGQQPQAKRKRHRLSIHEGEVNVILRSVERLGPKDAHCAEQAIHALSHVISNDMSIASIFLMENAGAVLRELSVAHKHKSGVLGACNAVLCTLCSPAVFYYVSDL